MVLESSVIGPVVLGARSALVPARGVEEEFGVPVESCAQPSLEGRVGSYWGIVDKRRIWPFDHWDQKTR